MYRTRGGPVPWEGRVEVKVDGTWGTICDRLWDFVEGNIVCRAMGYGTAQELRYRANYGRGSGFIHYSDLRSVIQYFLIVEVKLYYNPFQLTHLGRNYYSGASE